MTDARDPGPALRATLEDTAEGLLYTSESDRPFAFFALPGGAEGWPYDGETFARRVGLAEGTRVETRDLDDFLARHIETSDPYDVEAQRIRPRYEALKETLRTRLRDVRVFRAGSVEVACWMVGDDGRGNLVGLTTTAIET